MGINLGSTAISSIKLGTTQVDKIYLGSTQVYGGSTPPVTIKALKFTSSGAQTLGVDATKLGTVSPNFEYSTDNGATWTTWNVVNDTLPFGNGTDLYLRGSNSIISKSGSNYTNFVFSTSSPVYCSGNIMHLFDYTQDLTSFPQDTNSRGTKYLFYNCTQLMTAPELPATTLAPSGSTYYYMFAGCTSLTTPPSLPATPLQAYSYDHMFYGCTSLDKIPQLSGAILAGQNIASSMFENCINIKMSETQEGDYTNLYDFGYPPGSALNMFAGTGGTFTSGNPPQILYTSNEIIQ